MAENITFTSAAKQLSGTLHMPDEKARACVITSHGFESHKDSDKYVELARRLLEVDIATFRFDFRGCGDSEGDLVEDAPDRIHDLRAAIELMSKHSPEKTSLGLMGSSYGGLVSLLVASEPSYSARIAAVVSWAAPIGFMSLDILSNLENIQCPVLVIHGEQDELVPAESARRIYGALRSVKELEIISGANHRFLDPRHRERAMSLTVEWFKRYL